MAPALAPARTGVYGAIFGKTGFVTYGCHLSEYLFNTCVASLKRWFASSVTSVPESAAERRARSQTRSTLQGNVSPGRVNTKSRVIIHSHIVILVCKLWCNSGEVSAYINQFHGLILVRSADVPRIVDKY